MSGKGFKDNPALQFLTIPEPQEPEEQDAPRGDQTERGAARAHVARWERKSKRVQLLIKPSLYEWAKDTAEARGQSLNDFIHEAIENERDRLKGE